MADILQGIANPAIANVPGAIASGRQARIGREDRGREEETRRLAGDILKKTMGGKLGNLGKVSPKVAVELSQALGIPLNEKDRIQSMMGDIQIAATIFESAGPQAAAEFAAEKASMLEGLGIQPTQYLETIQGLTSQDPNEVQAAGQALINLRDGFISQGLLKGPSQVKSEAKFSPKTSVLDDGSTIQTTNTGLVIVKNPSGEVVTGQAAANTIERANQAGVDIQTKRAGGRAGATAQVARVTDIINKGTAAAESTATIRRALTLLETVKTGGVDAISLSIKQSLGIEGANEGELSNSLGKAVLSQLRETFGAAFTEREGDRLDRIEANFGKSPASNKRLLQQTLRISENAARRAIKAARKDDRQDVVADIEGLLTFSLDIQEEAAVTQQPAQTGASRFQIEVIE